MKQVRVVLLVFIIGFCWVKSYAQDFSNLYIQGRPAMLFGSVQPLNGELYVTGVTNTIRSPNYSKALFGKIAYSGEAIFISSIADSDNHQYAFFTNSLKRTADGNFIASEYEVDSIQKALLMKADTNGNILLWRTYTEPNTMFFDADDVVETPDSGYILVVNMQASDYVSSIVIIRTDDSGNILNKVNYGNGPTAYPWVIRRMYNGHYMVGAWVGPANGNTPYHAHTWLIEVDSMGNEVRNWLDPDPTNLWPNGMEQTADSGWIIVRQHVAYDVSNFQEYNGSVLKLDKNFNKQWDIHVGDSSDLTGFNDIKILPDGKYIACGTTPTWGYDSAYYWGLLAKIDTNGAMIWDRKYTAFAEFGAHSILSSLQYLDNGNIVACGQLELTFNTGTGASQQGWILQTDSNGCLLDNCGWVATEVPDISNNQFGVEIFPNPSKSNFTVKLSLPPADDISINVYDITGRLTLHTPLTQQTTTIQNQLNSGMYLWQITDNAGVLSAGKLVVMH